MACSIIGCETKGDEPNIVFYHFPPMLKRSVELRAQWTQGQPWRRRGIGRVCSRHFPTVPKPTDFPTIDLPPGTDIRKKYPEPLVLKKKVSDAEMEKIAQEMLYNPEEFMNASKLEVGNSGITYTKLWLLSKWRKHLSSYLIYPDAAKRAIRDAPEWMRRADDELQLVHYILQKDHLHEYSDVARSVADAAGPALYGALYGVLEASKMRTAWSLFSCLVHMKLQWLSCRGDVWRQLPRVARLSPVEWEYSGQVIMDDDHVQWALIYSVSALGRSILVLLQLAKLYKLEDYTASRELRERRWAAACRVYRKSGLHCPPLLLQRRWQQLKQDARQAIAAPHKYRPHLYHWLLVCRFPHVVTQALPTWQQLRARGFVYDLKEHDLEKLESVEPDDKEDNEDYCALLETMNIELPDLKTDGQEDTNDKNLEISFQGFVAIPSKTEMQAQLNKLNGKLLNLYRKKTLEYLNEIETADQKEDQPKTYSKIFKTYLAKQSKTNSESEQSKTNVDKQYKTYRKRGNAKNSESFSNNKIQTETQNETPKQDETFKDSLLGNPDNEDIKVLDAIKELESLDPRKAETTIIFESVEEMELCDNENKDQIPMDVEEFQRNTHSEEDIKMLVRYPMQTFKKPRLENYSIKIELEMENVKNEPYASTQTDEFNLLEDLDFIKKEKDSGIGVNKAKSRTRILFEDSSDSCSSYISEPIQRNFSPTKFESNDQSDSDLESSKLYVCESENIQSESENIGTESENIQTESENIQSESENIQSESKNFQSETENIHSESENIQSKSAYIQAESENIETESENIKSKSKNIQSESENIKTVSKNIQFESENIQSVSENIQSASENIQTVSKNIQSESENIQSESENIQSVSENIQTESENIETESENIQTESEKNIQPESEKNIQPESENIQSESDNIQTESKNIQSGTENIHSEAENIKSKSAYIQAESENIETESENIKSKSENIQSESENIKTVSKNIQFESENIQSVSENIETESKNVLSESYKSRTSGKVEDLLPFCRPLSVTLQKLSPQECAKSWSWADVGRPVSLPVRGQARLLPVAQVKPIRPATSDDADKGGVCSLTTLQNMIQKELKDIASLGNCCDARSLMEAIDIELELNPEQIDKVPTVKQIHLDEHGKNICHCCCRWLIRDSPPWSGSLLYFHRTLRVALDSVANLLKYGNEGIAKYVVSEEGRSLLRYGGYEYHFEPQYRYRNYKQWYCFTGAGRRDGCPATITTLRGAVVAASGKHNHPSADLINVEESKNDDNDKHSLFDLVTLISSDDDNENEFIHKRKNIKYKIDRQHRSPVPIASELNQNPPKLGKSVRQNRKLSTGPVSKSVQKPKMPQVLQNNTSILQRSPSIGQKKERWSKLKTYTRNHTPLKQVQNNVTKAEELMVSTLLPTTEPATVTQNTSAVLTNRPSLSTATQDVESNIIKDVQNCTQKNKKSESEHEPISNNDDVHVQIPTSGEKQSKPLIESPYVMTNKHAAEQNLSKISTTEKNINISNQNHTLITIRRDEEDTCASLHTNISTDKSVTHPDEEPIVRERAPFVSNIVEKGQCGTNHNTGSKPMEAERVTDNAEVSEVNTNASDRNSPDVVMKTAEPGLENLKDDNDDTKRTQEKRPCSSRCRPVRTSRVFSIQQFLTLEAEFEKNKYLPRGNASWLARLLGLKESQIKIWFQNRRMRWKRKNFECGQWRGRGPGNGRRQTT